MEEEKVAEKKHDFSLFITFGDIRDHEFKRREPVIHVNSQKLETSRKQILSVVKEVNWTKSKYSPGISLAHLYHNKSSQLMIGLIKMEARSTKSAQNTGPVSHKFVVLTGEINVQIEDAPVYKNNGVNTIVRIPTQTVYSIKNIQNDDTYLFFKSHPHM